MGWVLVALLVVIVALFYISKQLADIARLLEMIWHQMPAPQRIDSIETGVTDANGQLHKISSTLENLRKRYAPSSWERDI